MNFTKKELQDISRENADKWVEKTFDKSYIQDLILMAVEKGKESLILYCTGYEEELLRKNALLIRRHLENVFPDLDIKISTGLGLVTISWE
ncbi:hypothetical protein MFLO_16015 [Listeria floridensis FSL S10-1187]|uniref:Uncharacterized protein n=1 Tax=Listeria floridensis FSL S10-1187 TaxID=1265817 RepID=A0ABN0RBH9_9LIST|nr:hypothetical protein [Listeria floridensis]EUJ23368.1 hypothetical protein MFLO_16015 [Listeria floridensis FSL S10-1187]